MRRRPHQIAVETDLRTAFKINRQKRERYGTFGDNAQNAHALAVNPRELNSTKHEFIIHNAPDIWN